MVILFRILVILKFSYKYADSDQSIMWLGVINYSKGIFHEPGFYGQSYNTMLEAIFAVPLYKLGIPPYKALPIITSFMTLFPYVLVSFLTFLKKHYFPALVILTIPLLLPNEYAMLTSLPRGFITGIFVSTFGIIAIYFPTKRIGFFMLGFFSLLGYTVNANSVIITLPCLLCFFLYNYKNKRFYFYAGSGLLLAGLLYFLFHYFYMVHPFYNLHKYTLSFSLNLLLSNLSHLDKHFNFVSPLFWKQGFLALFLLLFGSIFLIIKKQTNHGIALLATLVFIIITLGINKINDGTDSIFYSLSRMYLGIPVLMAMYLALLKERKHYIYIYMTITMLFFATKVITLNTSVTKNLNPDNHHVNTVAKIDNICKECKKLDELSKTYNVKLIVIVNHYYYDFFDYGCVSFYNDFPKTLRPSYERRTWRLLEDENKVYKNIMIIDDQHSLKEGFKNIKTTNYGYLVLNNNRKTMQLLKTLNIKVRKYKKQDIN